MIVTVPRKKPFLDILAKNNPGQRNHLSRLKVAKLRKMVRRKVQRTQLSVSKSNISTTQGMVNLMQRLFTEKKLFLKKHPQGNGKLWKFAEHELYQRVDDFLLGDFPRRKEFLILCTDIKMDDALRTQKFVKLCLLIGESPIEKINTLKLRLSSLDKIHSGIDEQLRALPKKSGAETEKQKLVLANAMDGFAHVITYFGFLRGIES